MSKEVRVGNQKLFVGPEASQAMTGLEGGGDDRFLPPSSANCDSPVIHCCVASHSTSVT